MSGIWEFIAPGLFNTPCRACGRRFVCVSGFFSRTEVGTTAWCKMNLSCFEEAGFDLKHRNIIKHDQTLATSAVLWEFLFTTWKWQNYAQLLCKFQPNSSLTVVTLDVQCNVCWSIAPTGLLSGYRKLSQLPQFRICIIAWNWSCLNLQRQHLVSKQIWLV